MEGEPDQEYNPYTHEIPRHIRLTPWSGNPPEPSLGSDSWVDTHEEKEVIVLKEKKKKVRIDKRIELRHPDGRVMVFAGIRLAAEYLKVTYGAVRYSMVLGYMVQGWRAYPYTGDVIPERDVFEKRVAVIGFKSGEHRIWKSRVEAAESIEVSPQNLRYSIRCKTHLKGWLLFDYDPDKEIADYNAIPDPERWVLTKDEEVQEFRGYKKVAAFLGMGVRKFKKMIKEYKRPMFNGWEVRKGG